MCEKYSPGVVKIMSSEKKLLNDSERVVITGIGIVAPNGNNKKEFDQALRNGESGIKFHQDMQELGFRAHVGGRVKFTPEFLKSKIDDSHLKRMSETMTFAAIAALECLEDSNMFSEEQNVPVPQNQEPLWDIGCIIGACNNGVDLIVNEFGPNILNNNIKKLGISVIEKTMTSGVSAKIAGLLGLGNRVSTNSSACSTGADAVLEGYYHIKSQRAVAMLCGGSEGGAPFTWAGFDAMRLISSKFNDNPELASRPFSESSTTFVPGSGAAILMLERYDHAKKRNAKIYAEIIGGASNCGGHRLGGSMTAPNNLAVQRCIESAIKSANINTEEIDYINGHFTGTMGDLLEFNNYKTVLNLSEKKFPYINGTKSLIGHGLGAAGAQEIVATIMQMNGDYIHMAKNSDDLYPELLNYREKIPQNGVQTKINIALKSSLGFGDVNTVLLFKNLK